MPRSVLDWRRRNPALIPLLISSTRRQTKRPPLRVACIANRVFAKLRDGDDCAFGFELGLGFRSALFRDGFQHNGWRALDEVLGFLQAQIGQGANSLDD